MGTHNRQPLAAKMKVLGAVGALCIIVCILQPTSAELLQEEGAKQTRLFGGYSTRTRLSTLTSTMLYSCASSVKKGTTCGGRKKRRATTVVDDNESLEKRSLDSSLDENKQLASSTVDRAESKNDQVGRLFIAMTTFTTITTTSFTYNRSTTVSISYLCLPLGGTIPPVCG